jgi:hypothetical protein
MTDIKHRVVDEVEALEYNIEWLIEQRRRIRERDRTNDWEPDVIDYLKEKEEL